ncbi:hypothetical protein AA0119_g13195 [Alternaria tenuissima]|uniref:Thioesterase domain-containing protein n=2 Tax=Alternaria alternata complex TaxID=187734 RepID=A0A4Q4MYM0_ALTAL|nr:hypothetical protein AA0117_g12678 [Alternaria alternata]RYN85712.1 hypothetical protein AA0119_g13195 [Alternaria tenuissima]RYO00931.1 hypothetical protein AA0121_g13322 [Alternaria tenuissima]RYO44977.1 hypothetical protein AA0116_g13496 [Alternaria tenuissima]
MSGLDDGLENPVLIQEYSRQGRATAAPAPLVLFHDGGGTLFSYFFLESLGRDVFGFADPRATSGQQWKDGITEMAIHYYRRMKMEIRPGSVILGGWSFGGLLALQLAQMIASDSAGGFEVVGVILIDTSCPEKASYSSTVTNGPIVPFRDDVPDRMQEVVRASMVRNTEMLSQWEPPTWPQGYSKPPVLLLRAVEGIDAKKERSLKLGWELCQHDVIDSVEMVPGNHYSLFESENIGTLSSRLRESCKRMEAPYRKAAGSD